MRDRRRVGRVVRPGLGVAADGTLTLNAGDGSTLAGHSFTVYKVAGYNDVVKDGANVKSVSASSPDARPTRGSRPR